MLTTKILNLIITLWWMLVSAVQATNWSALKTKAFFHAESVLRSESTQVTLRVLLSFALSVMLVHFLINFFLFALPNRVQSLSNLKRYAQERTGRELRLIELLIPGFTKISSIAWLKSSATKSFEMFCRCLRGCYSLVATPLLIFFKLQLHLRVQSITNENGLLISRDFILEYSRKADYRGGVRLKLTIETGRLVYHLQFFKQANSAEIKFGRLWTLDFRKLILVTVAVRLVVSFGVSGWGNLWRQMISRETGITGTAFLEPSAVDYPNHHIQNYWNHTEFGNRFRASLRRNSSYPGHLFDPRRYLGPKAPTGEPWEVWIQRLLEGAGGDGFKIVSIKNEYTERTKLGWFMDRFIKIGCFIFIMFSLFFFYSALSEGKYVKAIRKYGDKINPSGGDHHDDD